MENLITTRRTITKLVALGDPSPGIIIQLSWKPITANENWKLCMANAFTLFSWWLLKFDGCLSLLGKAYLFLPKSCFSLSVATAEGGAYMTSIARTVVRTIAATVGATVAPTIASRRLRQSSAQPVAATVAPCKHGITCKRPISA